VASTGILLEGVRGNVTRHDALSNVDAHREFLDVDAAARQ
jgi:hypothetical protein